MGSNPWAVVLTSTKKVLSRDNTDAVLRVMRLHKKLQRRFRSICSLQYFVVFTHSWRRFQISLNVSLLTSQSRQTNFPFFNALPIWSLHHVLTEMVSSRTILKTKKVLNKQTGWNVYPSSILSAQTGFYLQEPLRELSCCLRVCRLQVIVCSSISPRFLVTHSMWKSSSLNCICADSKVMEVGHWRILLPR